MLSWRCPDNPAAGGAEVLTREMLMRMVARGHEVTWFAAAFPGSVPEEVKDGIRYVRAGRQWSVHVRAWRWLRGRIDSYDRVVDQVNTLPFLTPWYVDGRRRLLIYQLAREYWFKQTSGIFRLVAPFGYALEPLYLSLYRRTRAITISESSAQDLVRVGIPRGRVTVLPMSMDIEPLEALPAKTVGDAPRFVTVSRLTPAKFFEEGILAFARVQQRLPGATLDVIGSGDPEYRTHLEALVADRGLRGVVFHGRVSYERRRELVREAHIHLFTSHREGWGLVVSEAGADGTPSLGYDAPGVRDSIADPAQLVPIGDVDALGDRAVELLADPARYEAARVAAWERAKAMSPECTADVFEAAVA